MQRKILYTLLSLVILVALFYKSPFFSAYNYNKAKSLYTNSNYEQAIKYLETAVSSNPKDLTSRVLYVRALSKVKPTFSVQKKLYDIANDKNNDSASKLAKFYVAKLKQNIINQIGMNYIYNATMGTEIVRWDISKFPLKIYIDKSNSDVPQYYYDKVLAAVNQWQSRTSFLKFTTNNVEKNNADIVVLFSDRNSQNCNNEGNCNYIAAYTTPDISQDKTLRKMTLTVFKTNPAGEHFTPQQIYSTALHEIGHTLGIMGHSDNPSDIMYSAQDNNAHNYSIFGNQRLSDRDLKTLVLLYRTKPTVSNTKNINSESFYYAPLVIGSEDLILDKKIKELKDYIKKYPQIATGYINLAGIYSDSGEFDLALKYLDLATPLAKSNNEKYMINYNRAIVYYNIQNKQKALEYANQARNYSEDNNINELIQDIEKMN